MDALFRARLRLHYERNGGTPPAVYFTSPKKMAQLGARDGAGYGCGLYLWRSRSIYVSPIMCATPGRGYSWPGAAADRTLGGVLAHELGHHVHATWRNGEDAISLPFQRVARGTRVTSYEPNVYEAFAETFRVWFTNPDLLRAGRPSRYAFLREELALRPVETRRWRTVLGAAPQRYVSMVEKWIARGK